MSIALSKTSQHLLSLQAKKVTYSMKGSRTGTDGTADCSGALYAALVAAGAKKMAYIPNTDSLHKWLMTNNFQLIWENANFFTPQTYDIFIWGKQGFSGGAFGHTGLFFNQDEQIIHCNAATNGISINDYNQTARANSWPYAYIYRYQKLLTQTQWQKEIGTFIIDSPVGIFLRGEVKEAHPFEPIKLPVLSLLKAGAKVAYNACLVEPNGHVWIRQVRKNGFGYLPTGRTKNGRRCESPWGRFY